MPRSAAIAALLIIAGCSRQAPPASTSLDPAEPPPKPHPLQPVVHAEQTVIGEIRAIDLAHERVTVAVVSGAVQERSGIGRVERLHMARSLLVQVRVGEVVECKVRTTARGPEVIAVNRHVHHEPKGLPPELR